MRLIPRIPRNDKADLVVFGALFVIGVLVSIFLTPYGGLRPYLAVLAFASSLTFVTVYSSRRWWSSPAGRAVMFSMFSITMLSGHVTLALIWPDVQDGYPGQLAVSEIIYIMIALSAAYKVRALTRYSESKPESLTDHSYGEDASYGQPSSSSPEPETELP